VSLAGARFRELLIGILATGHCVRFPALGHSMHPAIQHGDLVTLAPLGDRRLSGDDVVAVVRNAATRQIMVHRVRRVNNEAVETRGDALPSPDGWFPRAAIIGVVVRVERQGKAVAWRPTPWSRLRQAVRHALARGKGKS